MSFKKEHKTNILNHLGNEEIEGPKFRRSVLLPSIKRCKKSGLHWRWKQYFRPEYWFLYTDKHGVTQKTKIVK